MSLMTDFPRIFALASTKVGVVAEFGSWQGQSWVWEVKTRRPLFDWERAQWAAFIRRLDQYKPCLGISNAVAWSCSSNGLFSVGSFRQCLEELEVECSTDFKFIWQGVAEETVDHLFLFCPRHIGNADANSAEIFAIHQACVLCAGSLTLVGKEVHIISDSIVAVSWVNGSGFGCLKHVKLIYDIRNLLRFLGRISVSHNIRSSNSFADSLAKKGSNMEGDSVNWSLD
ncbi:hypothetical protein Dsin_030865 [Dipteronia sinensis]|uniref:RNase H type-1 domain-containing protein n=1 Tax=Dipteronia sinensis TaxID=43782 RepID=A0AAD9ZLQ7_9ROSI|nr:hypothetical protein Dsin_030865 [Dipteronia sinensis]